jgi:hypothetical protein
MKSAYISAVCLIFAHVPSISYAADYEIFRSISINGKRTINLGDGVDRYLDICRLEEDRCRLDESVFGGAQSITLLVNDQGAIDKMLFSYEYENIEDYWDKVQVYRKYFDDEGVSTTEPVKSVTWNDGSTKFEVLILKHSDTATPSELLSLLTDLNP